MGKSWIMDRAWAGACAGLAIIALASTPQGVLAETAHAAPKLMTFGDLRARPLPKPSARIAYGELPEQFVELWLPQGTGPFPVVVMVHGGCWLSNAATLEIMNFAAEDLRRRGIAVWNIEYRGIDRQGGGYPGTFLDVAAGADALSAAAAQYKLRLDDVVAVGHSAGGHLVFWLAARPKIAPTSALYAAAPLRMRAAISLGGLPDLRLAHDGAIGSGCGAARVEKLTGTANTARPDVYADTSPASLAPFGNRQILVSGYLDPIVPPGVAAAYVKEVTALGDSPTATIIPDSGHAELIAPETPAWSREVEMIENALDVSRQ